MARTICSCVDGWRRGAVSCRCARSAVRQAAPTNHHQLITSRCRTSASTRASTVTASRKGNGDQAGSAFFDDLNIRGGKRWVRVAGLSFLGAGQIRDRFRCVLERALLVGLDAADDLSCVQHPPGRTRRSPLMEDYHDQPPAAPSKSSSISRLSSASKGLADFSMGDRGSFSRRDRSR